MIRLLWAASTNIRYAMRRYLPSNVLLDAVRTRRGLKWGVPAMLLAIPYLLLADLCVRLLADGGPGWLHLIVLVCIWSALKMLWIGPVSIFLLVRSACASTGKPGVGAVKRPKSKAANAPRWSARPTTVESQRPRDATRGDGAS